MTIVNGSCIRRYICIGSSSRNLHFPYHRHWRSTYGKYTCMAVCAFVAMSICIAHIGYETIECRFCSFRRITIVIVAINPEYNKSHGHINATIDKMNMLICARAPSTATRCQSSPPVLALYAYAFPISV